MPQSLTKLIIRVRFPGRHVNNYRLIAVKWHADIVAKRSGVTVNVERGGIDRKCDKRYLFYM